MGDGDVSHLRLPRMSERHSRRWLGLESRLGSCNNSSERDRRAGP